MGYNPFSNERIAYDAAKSLEHALGDEKPYRDLRLTRRAQRVQNRYDRGATVRLPAEFLPDGAVPAQRGLLCLTQRQADPSWSVGRFRDRSPAPVTIQPGAPTADDADNSLIWRARVGETEGRLVLPAEFGAAFAAHLTVRP